MKQTEYLQVGSMRYDTIPRKKQLKFHSSSKTKVCSISRLFFFLIIDYEIWDFSKEKWKGPKFERHTLCDVLEVFEIKYSSKSNPSVKIFVGTIFRDYFPYYRPPILVKKMEWTKYLQTGYMRYDTSTRKNSLKFHSSANIFVCSVCRDFISLLQTTKFKILVRKK